MARWLLLDYGQVLCTAPPADEWSALAGAAGYEDLDRFHDAYWAPRLAYDRADLTFDEYWAQVAAPGSDLATLRRIDVDMWLHPHRPSVEAADRAAGRGWRLALFSNAPVEVAEGIDGLGWLARFEHRFFSCRIGRVKPEPEAYAQVLAGLGAAPGDVVFFDDRPANVDGAAAFGIEAHLFTDAAQIDELPGDRAARRTR